MHNYGSNILCFDTNSLIFHFRFDYFRKRADCELIYFSLMQTLCWHFLVLKNVEQRNNGKLFSESKIFFFIIGWYLFVSKIILWFWNFGPFLIFGPFMDLSPFLNFVPWFRDLFWSNFDHLLSANFLQHGCLN